MTKEVFSESGFTVTISIDTQFNGQYSYVEFKHQTGGYYGCDSEEDISLENIKKLHSSLGEYLEKYGIVENG